VTTAAEELEAKRQAEIDAEEAKKKAERDATEAQDAKVRAIIEATEPLFDRVLVKMHRRDVTAGGIHLGDREKVSATLAYVVKKGPACLADKVRVGGLVVLMKHMGVDLDFPGFQTIEKYKLVRESEIAGALDGPAVEAWLRAGKAIRENQA